jgi:hypothetical protein
METLAKIQFWMQGALDPKLTLQYLMIARFVFIILGCCVLQPYNVSILSGLHLVYHSFPLAHYEYLNHSPRLKHCNSAVVLIVDNTNCLLLVPLFQIEHQVQHNLMVHKA